MSQEAQGASQMQRPSEALRRFIQAGAMAHIGYAEPRPLTGTGPVAPSQFTVDVEHATGAMLARQAIAPAPPVLDSPQRFAVALVSTILPALIERPRALAMWCSLARTMFAIGDSKVGWDGALQYSAAHLAQAARANASLSVVDTRILSDLQWKSIELAAHGAQGLSNLRASQSPQLYQQQQHQQQQGDRRAQGGNNICRKFNSSSGCNYEGCRWAHICGRCGAHGHPESRCMGADSQATAARPFHGGRRGGGNRA